MAITPDIAQLFPGLLLLYSSVSCADLWQLGKKNHSSIGEKNSCYDEVRHPYGADYGRAIYSRLCGRHGRQLLARILKSREDKRRANERRHHCAPRIERLCQI